MSSVLGKKNCRDTWYFLFEQNERAYWTGAFSEVLTDLQLIERFKEHYPNSKPNSDSVRKVRLEYNAGKLSRGKHPYWQSGQFFLSQKGELLRRKPRKRKKIYFSAGFLLQSPKG
jgi:hypothetical protein